jgi:hypothetical protein
MVACHPDIRSQFQQNHTSASVGRYLRKYPPFYWSTMEWDFFFFFQKKEEKKPGTPRPREAEATLLGGTPPSERLHASLSGGIPPGKLDCVPACREGFLLTSWDKYPPDKLG